MAESAVPIRRTKPQLWLWYENAPSNQSRCRLSPGETCRIVDRWYVAERENVVRGLVPRWGGGGTWQNPRCQFAVPSHNSVFSYPGVPAPAGMSDCYESMSRTPTRNRLPPLISSFQRKLESRGVGRGKCSAVEDYARRGARPPLGAGWGVADSLLPTRCTKPNSGFSCLGVAAPIGKSDCYEYGLSPLISSFHRNLESRRRGHSQAGIQEARTRRRTSFILLCGSPRAKAILWQAGIYERGPAQECSIYD